MEVFTRFEDLPFIKEGVLTIGFFDGMHIGHRKIIKTVEKTALHKGGKKIVFTFTNHPLSYLDPEKKLFLISSRDYVKEVLENRIDYLILQEFNEQFCRIRPYHFLEMLKNSFEKLKLIIGRNFHFGFKNEGNIQTLEKFSKNFPHFSYKTIYPLHYQWHMISSSYIRELITNGDMNTVTKLLKREFFIENTVIHGDGLGQKITYPTANITVPEGQVVPKFGVYKGKVEVAGKKYSALIYIHHKKLNKFLGHVLIESYLLYFNQNIYNQKIRVFFSEWIREPIDFESIDELRKQLNKDFSQIKE